VPSAPRPDPPTPPARAPRRIGIVCYPTFGGSGVVATELGLALAARGYEVHLVSYAAPARLPSFDARIRLHEVEVSSYPLFRYPPYDLALASRLSEVAVEARLDLVHVHYAIPHTLAALLVKDIVRPMPLPVVTTLHGTDITVVGQDRSYWRVTRYAIERSDAVTSVSRYLEARTRQVFGVERGIAVVPNFVDLDRFRPRPDDPLRARLASPRERVLVHVSNFRPVKRAVRAVEAFARVAAAAPARLIMVGDGPDRGACEARARDLGVRERVRFLGAQAGVEEILPCADLFLLPSEYESFGLAALEAMACGVVPVASDAGGLPEVVRDGVDGVLVDPDDEAAMGEAAAALLADPARLAAMKLEARRTAETRFARDLVVPLYEEVYRGALAAR
jgi:N-acetyl-alpha-D-glucosaminyl L-malate synthase BshA